MNHELTPESHPLQSVSRGRSDLWLQRSISSKLWPFYVLANGLGESKGSSETTKAFPWQRQQYYRPKHGRGNHAKIYRPRKISRLALGLLLILLSGPSHKHFDNSKQLNLWKNPPRLAFRGVLRSTVCRWFRKWESAFHTGDLRIHHIPS